MGVKVSEAEGFGTAAPTGGVVMPAMLPLVVVVVVVAFWGTVTVKVVVLVEVMVVVDEVSPSAPTWTSAWAAATSRRALKRVESCIFAVASDAGDVKVRRCWMRRTMMRWQQVD